jgi:hypothetical protein
VAVGAPALDRARTRLAPVVVGLALVVVGALVGLLSGRSEDGVRGYIVGPAVLALIVVPLFRYVRRHPEHRRLLPIVGAGLLLRLVFAVMHLLIGFFIYGGAIDFVGYHDLAGTFIDYYLLPQVDPDGMPKLKPDHFNQGFLANFVTILFVVLLRIFVGPQLLGHFLVTAALGTVASWLFYRAFEIACPEASGRRFYLTVMFLLPSVGFWSIFLGKDVIVFFWLAVATYAVAYLLRAVALRHVVLLGVALAFLLIMRAPVGAGVVCATVTCIILRPLHWRGVEAWLKPVQRILLVVGLPLAFYYLAADVLVRMGIHELTLEAVAERAALQHGGFAKTAGGAQLESALTTADPAAVASFLPLGMATLLFRPFLWEAHNALAVVAGVENLVFMALILWRLPALLRSLRHAPTSPFLLFVGVSFLTITVALSFQWNLGATARLRTMAMPFALLLMAGPTPRPWRRDAAAP